MVGNLEFGEDAIDEDGEEDERAGGDRASLFKVPTWLLPWTTGIRLPPLMATPRALSRREGGTEFMLVSEVASALLLFAEKPLMSPLMLLAPWK